VGLPLSNIFNFSAGPAVLPAVVLERAQGEMTDWHGSGMSVMEMSHRGAEFLKIAAQAEGRLRQLLGIEDDYAVLFLQGGATSQFTVIPMNLLSEGQAADYVRTGEWSKKAIKEAQKIATVREVASSESAQFSEVPEFESWDVSAASGYVHITSNETIGGLEFQNYPEKLSVPLVADMSSHILSRPIDVSRFGLIYAGAQKNIGPAGLTIVIVRKDLLGKSGKDLPSMFDYSVQAKNESMFNTPPTYSIYMAGLVFEWALALGGLVEIEKMNIDKSSRLYDEIDRTGFYRSPVNKSHRSRMNVPFRIHDESLEPIFLKKADENGLLQLKGHRSVGGIRASIYNAMPVEGVEALVSFMRAFENEHG